MLLSSRHRSRTMLSKAKHSTPTPSSAARRCAQRARQFVWQCRSHSEADDPLGAAIVAPFLTLWAILNLTLHHYFVAISFTTFVFFLKHWGPRRSCTSQNETHQTVLQGKGVPNSDEFLRPPRFLFMALVVDKTWRSMSFIALVHPFPTAKASTVSQSVMRFFAFGAVALRQVPQLFIHICMFPVVSSHPQRRNGSLPSVCEMPLCEAGPFLRKR